ncbi:unnamed protein product [Didymodactylos carnosus]|uniref:SGNH hydrolase-type esterase domain-containing protein n=2 Tax=Didymodactylos carnosus TaxID=1234261 RepID=A0A814MLI1_9BILA|nr:unnamed protein product [Didymodactylos carnosus]CAF3845701.1 unnamed protein product [Didymodactylos carnosus]
MTKLVIFIVISVMLVGTIINGETNPVTPTTLRGLWCLAVYNTTHNYTQLAQAYFYNNGTFTMNFLANITNTWVNYFTSVNNTDSDGTYRIEVITTAGAPVSDQNRTLCYWRKQISNGDVLWGNPTNGICAPTFVELDTLPRYTRLSSNCLYYDDETFEKISSTSFESELLEFDRDLSRSSLPQNAVAFYGSSSIRMWTTLANDFSSISVINRGFGGSTLKECVHQFKRVVYPLDPKVLLVYAGENDIADNQTSEQVFASFNSFVQIARQMLGDQIPIGFISIKPSPSRIQFITQVRQTNEMIERTISSMNDVTYIDVFNLMVDTNGNPLESLFSDDRLHMNAKGYQIWTKVVSDYLRSKGLLPDQTSTPSVAPIFKATLWIMILVVISNSINFSQ